MIRAKNYETVFIFVKVMPRKLVTFFPDTVYEASVHIDNHVNHVTFAIVLFCDI